MSNQDRIYYLTLDLKDDQNLIQLYEEHHKKIWPEITKGIKDSGVLNMQIYRVSTRLFMVMEVDEYFSFEKMEQMDKNNQKVQQWQNLMDQFQQRLPYAQNGEKWVLLQKIFDLKEQ
ncbi:hypothetical protein IMG5_194930 [Ichthyophthirius multifiliis]|uniref:L-rhamnose mutarotase n=1 Tax=Ichthyophthirius multifiliis TaxID=5932 RepID=G0R4U7_ICHMU|nr:hypothetical protein IMG5_194930 [Ichthyophthirius multifiliis]EGR27490.1 hypothetical protein IMG5_194930 [Ichthyophthirius multifiliis]|eukprot:XP_004024400.1 hypothetical protein IMG5_194930 [Ichthyophthirius multifiliis]